MESINEALKELNEQENISVDEIDKFKRDENGYITVYIVSSNYDTDDIEEQFLDKDSAISYAKENLEYETWVDKVAFNPDIEEEKVETIWTYEDNEINEELKEPTCLVLKYGKNIKATDYLRNLKAMANEIIESDYEDFIFDRESFNSYNVDIFEFYNDLVDELRNRGYGLSSIIIDHSKDKVGEIDLFNYKYTCTPLNEALSKKETEEEEKRRLSLEIGLQNTDDLRKFRRYIKEPFESDLDALRRYRKELGDHFKIKENFIERDKVYTFHRIPTWGGQFNFLTQRKITLDQLETEAKDQATYTPHIRGNKETSDYVVVVSYSNIGSSWISDIIYSNSPNEINNIRDALSDADSNSDIYIESINLKTGESTVINIIPNIRYYNNKPIENIGDRVIYEKMDVIREVLDNKKRKKIEEIIANFKEKLSEAKGQTDCEFELTSKEYVSDNFWNAFNERLREEKIWMDIKETESFPDDLKYYYVFIKYYDKQYYDKHSNKIKTKKVPVYTLHIGSELIIPNKKNNDLEKWIIRDIIDVNEPFGPIKLVLENESGDEKRLELDIGDKVKIKENINLNASINESVHDVAAVVSDSYNHFTRDLGRIPSIFDILNDITNNYDGYNDIQDTPELTEKWYQTIASELNRQGLKFTTDESLNEDYIAYETPDDLERVFKAYLDSDIISQKEELAKAVSIALYQTYNNEDIDRDRWEEIKEEIDTFRSTNK